MRIGLVGCVKRKQAHAAPAGELYTSTLFRGRRAAVEDSCDRWYILSALHGLLRPDEVIEPYDVALTNASTAQRCRWAASVLIQLRDELGSLDGLVFEIHAGAAYTDFGLVDGLHAAGATTERPLEGLPFGSQLAWYASRERRPKAHPGQQHGQATRRAATRTSASTLGERAAQLDAFYETVGELRARIGGARLLGDCDGRMGWPDRGVYLFFEPGELRQDGTTPRVTRVGTHGLSATSNTTLWQRLSQHRGNLTGSNPGGGNHRGSVFRLHVGTALIARDGWLQASPTWGKGSSADRLVREHEADLERAVSRHIGSMPLLWLDVPDRHDRAVIEQDLIALLSNAQREAIDPPSSGWLGHHADRDAIRDAGIWNVNHTRDVPTGEGLARFIGAVSRLDTAPPTR